MKPDAEPSAHARRPPRLCVCVDGLGGIGGAGRLGGPMGQFHPLPASPASRERGLGVGRIGTAGLVLGAVQRRVAGIDPRLECYTRLPCARPHGATPPPVSPHPHATSAHPAR